MGATVSDFTADQRRILVSLNPKAGARSGQPLVDRLQQRLTERGFSVEIISDVDRLADEAARTLRNGELRAVVAAGGDGTAALVVNRTPPQTPIAVLPLGTENLLSKHLGLTADPDAVCETICGGTTVQLDAGRAEGRIFLLMVGCGFDADVVRRLHRERTGHIHHLSYAKPIFDSIRNYEYPELRIYCDDESDATLPRAQAITARWVFVVNLPRYAGGLRIAPDAVGTDGLLDVCAFKEGSLWNGIRYLSGIIFGQHESWDDCVTRRTRRLRIESDAEAPFQLDGDPGGCLPVDIEVLPRRLTLLVPQHDSPHPAPADEKAATEKTAQE